MKSKFFERIITVEKQNDSVVYSGSTLRDLAHLCGIRHLTVIIVPFIADGENKGKWLVHNRSDKQLAKGLVTPPYSYNLFGGHCNPPENEEALLGKEISPHLLLDAAVREMSEELFIREDRGRELEIFGTENTIRVLPYPVSAEKLIPLGYADFNDTKDHECSYYFALPLPVQNPEGFIAADDYLREDGSKGNVALPVSLKTERELYELYRENNSDIEICNAISRLWEEQNKELYHRLLEMTQSV